MTLEAVIVDMDGTLADTERDGHRGAFNAAFRELELDWEWDEATYSELLEVAGGKERIKAYCARRGLLHDDPAALDALAARLMPDVRSQGQRIRLAHLRTQGVHGRGPCQPPAR